MFKYLFVLLAASAIICQAAHIAQPQHEVEGAADEAKKLYYKLLEVVADAINVASTTLNTALDTMKEYATEIETAAKDEIQGVLDSFQAELDEINQKAKDAGIDITDCRQYEVQFTQLPDTMLDNVVNCVNNQITAAQNNVNDALNRAMAIQQDFYNIEQEIDSCGSGLKSITCLAKLTIQIGEDVINGPSKISDDVDKTEEIIKNAWPEIKQCAEKAVESVPGQAGNIVKDFAVCAAIP